MGRPKLDVAACVHLRRFKWLNLTVRPFAFAYGVFAAVRCITKVENIFSFIKTHNLHNNRKIKLKRAIVVPAVLLPKPAREVDRDVPLLSRLLAGTRATGLVVVLPLAYFPLRMASPSPWRRLSVCVARWRTLAMAWARK
jgi:hypothetical protein